MRHLNLQFKSTVGGEGTFTGDGAVFNNLDSYGDRILPGAFKADLAARGSRRPLCWQHDAANVIGFIDCAEYSGGLRVKGTLILDVPQAQVAYSLLKADGALSGLSIGYETEDSAFVNGERHISEIKLWEVSLVTFPANALATVDSVKSSDQELRELARIFEGMASSIAAETLLANMRAFRGSSR